MATLTKETFYNAWTEKYQQTLQEQKLAILMELGEEGHDALTDFRLTDYELTDLPFEIIYSLVFSNGVERMEYFITDSEHTEETVYFEREVSPLKNAGAERFIAKMLKDAGFTKLFSQLWTFQNEPEAFEAFLKHLPCPIPSIQKTDSAWFEGIYVSTEEADYTVMLASKKEDVAKNVLIREFERLEFLDYETGNCPISAIQRMTGLPADNILSLYPDVAEEDQEPHLSSDDSFDLVYNVLGEKQFVEKIIQGNGYQSFFGTMPCKEKQIGDYLLYQTR